MKILSRPIESEQLKEANQSTEKSPNKENEWATANSTPAAVCSLIAGLVLVQLPFSFASSIVFIIINIIYLWLLIIIYYHY